MKTARASLIIASLLTALAASAQTAMPASGEHAGVAPAAQQKDRQRHDGKRRDGDHKRHEKRHDNKRHAHGERAARDPAQHAQRRAERHAQHMAQLKQRLNITAAQESAWTQFSAAMQPPTPPAAAPTPWEQLTTPQRLDAMQQRDEQRRAHMAQRHQAIKAFYAQLSPEQQKAFDQRGHGQRHGHNRPAKGERR